MNKVTIVSAIVDEQKVVLYLADGANVTLKQGDPRLRDALKVIVPATDRGETVTIDLDTYELIYAEVEQKTKGLVKFFRVAKTKVLSFFNKEEAAAVKAKLEEVTYSGTPEPISFPENYKPPTKLATPDESSEVSQDDLEAAAAFRDEMLAPVPLAPEEKSAALTMAERFIQETAADPVSSINKVDASETIVAVVNGAVVEDVEKVEPFLRQALTAGRDEAVTNFFAKMAQLTKKRQFSAKDLFRFLQNADLPLTDDGCILAYKGVRPRPDSETHGVDDRTGKIKQGPGSFVCMPEEKVDPSRSNECSHGLHIGTLRHGIITYGDRIFLVKIDPRDVIAVPKYDGTKMRVRAYHILGLVSQEGYEAVKRREPFERIGQDGQLLSAALVGKHIPILEEVHCGQAHEPVSYHPVEHNAPSLDWKAYLTEAISEVALRKVTHEAEIALPVTVEELKAMKQANQCQGCKAEIPLTETHCEPCMEALTNPTPVPSTEEPEEKEPTLEEVPTTAAEVPVAEETKAPADVLPEPAPVQPAAKPSEPVVNKVRAAFNDYRNLPDKLSFSTMIAAKRKAKKSWSALGFTPKEEQEIAKLMKKYDI